MFTNTNEITEAAIQKLRMKIHRKTRENEEKRYTDYQIVDGINGINQIMDKNPKTNGVKGMNREKKLSEEIREALRTH